MGSEKMEYVLVLCALKDEYEALINKVQAGEPATIGGVAGTVFPIPSGLAFAFTGYVGKVGTAFILGKIASCCKVKAIINSGVAGSLSDEATPLTVVFADKVAFHDVDLTAFNLPYGMMDEQPLWFEAGKEFREAAKDLQSQRELQIKIGSMISGDSFVTKKNMPEKMIEYFGHPLAVDMEGATVGMVANLLHVPFAVIRSISDDTRKEGNRMNYEEFVELAAKHASSVTLWLLNSIK